MTTTEARLNELNVAIKDLEMEVESRRRLPASHYQVNHIGGLEVAITCLMRRRQEVKADLRAARTATKGMVR